MEGTIGEIRFFAGDFVPRNWAACKGQLLPITENTAVFSILGTRYGGDGRQTFALPDYRNLIERYNFRVIICLQGIYPSRS